MRAGTLCLALSAVACHGSAPRLEQVDFPPHGGARSVIAAVAGSAEVHAASLDGAGSAITFPAMPAGFGPVRIEARVEGEALADLGLSEGVVSSAEKGTALPPSL